MGLSFSRKSYWDNSFENGLSSFSETPLANALGQGCYFIVDLAGFLVAPFQSKEMFSSNFTVFFVLLSLFPIEHYMDLGRERRL